jgi:hypothetical protein
MTDSTTQPIAAWRLADAAGISNRCCTRRRRSLRHHHHGNLELHARAVGVGELEDVGPTRRGITRRKPTTSGTSSNGQSSNVALNCCSRPALQ